MQTYYNALYNFYYPPQLFACTIVGETQWVCNYKKDQTKKIMMLPYKIYNSVAELNVKNVHMYSFGYAC